MNPVQLNKEQSRQTSVLENRLMPVRKMLQACIQCGTCTGSCPNAGSMDVSPRYMWRLVLMGDAAQVFQTTTFALCSTCYTCSLRCPRGLSLTDAMSALKQIAMSENLARYKSSTRFYGSFIESVRRHGRVREMEFMTLYFLSMKNPLLPLKFTHLGMRLLIKGKIGIEIPSKGAGRLDALFRQAMALEDQQ
jgi:heterodisulfide reductase subunit C2